MNKQEAKRRACSIAAAELRAYLRADGSWSALDEGATQADYDRFHSAIEELAHEMDTRS